MVESKEEAAPVPQSLIGRLEAIFGWFAFRGKVVHLQDAAAVRFYEQGRKMTATPEVPMVVLHEARIRELERQVEALTERVSALDDPFRR